MRVRQGSQPFEKVAFDILTLVKTTQGNHYILMIVDQFTKWTEAIALPNHTAKTVAEAFMVNWICRFGTPRELHSDRGTEFTSQVMTALYDLLEVKKTQTTSY